MVDDKQLIKEFEEYIRNFHPSCTEEGMEKDMLREVLARFEERTRWISVSEKKPRYIANKVIVYVEHDDLVSRIGYGHYEKFKGEEIWYDLETQESFSKNGYTVTYWMPMPKSPEGEMLVLS